MKIVITLSVEHALRHGLPIGESTIEVDPPRMDAALRLSLLRALESPRVSVAQKGGAYVAHHWRDPGSNYREHVEPTEITVAGWIAVVDAADKEGADKQAALDESARLDAIARAARDAETVKKVAIALAALVALPPMDLTLPPMDNDTRHALNGNRAWREEIEAREGRAREHREATIREVTRIAVREAGTPVDLARFDAKKMSADEKEALLAQYVLPGFAEAHQHGYRYIGDYPLTTEQWVLRGEIIEELARLPARAGWTITHEDVGTASGPPGIEVNARHEFLPHVLHVRVLLTLTPPGEDDE